MDVCATCHQPECPNSAGGHRPLPGSAPSRLVRGQREYRGYGEWAVHPDEAIFLLHRGYAIVNQERSEVFFVQNEAHVTMLAVPATFGHHENAESLARQIVQEPVTR